jgi:transcription-repair coupling factor (superfamily II helicase)
LRLLCADYGVVKLDAAPTVILITFKPQAPVDPAAIIRLIQTHRDIKLAGNDRLRIEKSLPDIKARVQAVRDVFRNLGKPVTLSS